MKLKNAGLESIDEFIAGMDNGIKYYYDECVFYYRKSSIFDGKSPYVREHNEDIKSININFKNFKKMKIEKNWEDDLPSKKGIACFVSDFTKKPSFGNPIKVVNNKVKIGDKLYFNDKDGIIWSYATPMSKDYIWCD